MSLTYSGDENDQSLWILISVDFVISAISDPDIGDPRPINYRREVLMTALGYTDTIDPFCSRVTATTGEARWMSQLQFS